MIKEIEERHQREKESNSYINEQQCFDDREYLLSLVKKQRLALETVLEDIAHGGDSFAVVVEALKE